MKHGANIAAVNNDGDLAIDIAEDRGMQKLLREEMDKKGNLSLQYLLAPSNVFRRSLLSVLYMYVTFLSNIQLSPVFFTTPEVFFSGTMPTIYIYMCVPV